MNPIEIRMPIPVQKVLERLTSHGHEAYVVGGCVRDSLLGKAPNDWDITTSATPEETLEVFSDHRTIEIGRIHGTIAVLVDEMLLEITTYRNDGEYADNRHPVCVTFSKTVDEDLARRDFTVNAMAYHPEHGIVDLFKGQNDLSLGIIRCVGDPKVRFEEDGLRILRAIRFASVLDFSIDFATDRAIREKKELLRGIAAERIREELCKLLTGMGATRILRDYHEVIGVFLPELSRCVNFLQNSKYHSYDVFEHTVKALEYNRTRDLVTRLAILLHDIGKPLCYTEDEQGGHFKGHAPIGVTLTEEILSRLRFDNATIDRIKRLVELHDLPVVAQKRPVKRLMQKLSDEDIDRLIEVKRCDRLAHAPLYRELPPDLFEISSIVKMLREEAACLSLRDLAVNGTDLIAMGLSPGKRIGEILSVLFEEVLEERLPNDRETLLFEAKKRIG